MSFSIEIARASPIAAATAIGKAAEVVIAGEFTAAHWPDLTLLFPPLQEVAAMGLGVSRAAVHRTEVLAGSRSALTPMIRLEATVDDENAQRTGYGAVAAFVAGLRQNPSGPYLFWEPQSRIAHIEKDIHGVIDDFLICAGGKSLRTHVAVRAPGRSDLQIPMRLPRATDVDPASKSSDQLVGYFDGYCVSRRLLLAISEGGVTWRINYDEAQFLQQIIGLGARLSVNSRARCQFDVDVEIQAGGRQNFFLRAFDIRSIEPRVGPQDALPLEVAVGDPVSPCLEIA